MEKVMTNIFVNTNFAQNWMRWTNRRTAHISIGDKISVTFSIVSGVGQGDSSSSSPMQHSGSGSPMRCTVVIQGDHCFNLDLHVCTDLLCQ